MAKNIDDIIEAVLEAKGLTHTISLTRTEFSRLSDQLLIEFREMEIKVFKDKVKVIINRATQ